MSASLIPRLAVAAVAIVIAGPSAAQDSRSSTEFVAVDGDTIRSPAGVRYRLLGFDAPETGLAKCMEELDLGTRAKRRLQELIDSGGARLVESGKLDRYGRTLASLYVAGVDVAGTLVAEGLARPYAGGKRESWCPQEAQ